MIDFAPHVAWLLLLCALGWACHRDYQAQIARCRARNSRPRRHLRFTLPDAPTFRAGRTVR